MNTLKRRPFHRLVIFGLFALALANVAQYILTRHTAYSEHVTDPVSGFLFGVAIAMTLLGIAKQARQLRDGDHRRV